MSKTNDFFQQDLRHADAEIFDAVRSELKRQQDQIEMIASENIVSQAVLEAQGSVLTNKYAEGYPGKRYYGGCEEVDKVETIAIERAKKLFNCEYVNVQPNSGSQANQAVFLAMIKPGDTILGMSLAAGGHLTHGAKPNASGKWFNAVQYGVRETDCLIDYDEVEKLAQEHKPKLIIAGGSAYARQIDFARFRKIADAVGAYLMVDMAHFAGLVAGGVYNSPIPLADVVTTTTHKTLRGARGGMILSRDTKWAKKLNSAVFPGLQGGPLMHVIAGKAVAFKEALQPEFKEYSKRVVASARALANVLLERGYAVVSGGTDSHIVLLDMRPKNLKGNEAEESLERAGITSNKNAIPFDPQPPAISSGVRFGTNAGCTRGFGVTEFERIGHYISDVLDGLAKEGVENNAVCEQAVRRKIGKLCEEFPIY